ncbi:MAG: penicillin-binding protein 2 [Phycisphaerae bacterium]|nr:penicillin-binding protein 2 [Phycisphaerae bacterium]
MSSNKYIRDIWVQVMLVAILAAFGALIGRIVQINLSQGPTLTAKANRQHTAWRPILAQRGAMYDRRGRLLAGTCLTPSLFADPSMIRNSVEAASLAGNLVQKDPITLYQQLVADPNSQFLWLARDLPQSVADVFYSIPAKERRGLDIRREPKRIYPAGKLAGHILGAVSIDDRGLEGLELKYNAVLAGHGGSERFIRDAAGRRIWLLSDQYQAARNGQNLILTIDAVIQELTEKALEATCTKYKPESGVAIVMDPTSGEVLAWACWPFVNPNDFGSYPIDARRNRAIIDPFEPGSIFKPFVAVAALKHKVTRPGERIFCHNGAYTIGGRVLHDHHGYGDLTFEEIVIFSSNIGMGILGQRMGNDALYEAVTAFGFGKPTGVDLPGENGGIVRPRHTWNDYSTTSIPMGQEVAGTALQLLTAFAGLANAGMVPRPRLVRAVIDDSGQVIHDNSQPQFIGRAAEPQHARKMIEILARVIAEGTGKRGNVPGYQVFGKTGTAQVARSDGRGYKPRAYVASFLGGAPAPAPKLVCLVSIREPDPRVGHFGGTVAAPAVKEILEKTVKYLNIPPVETGEPAEAIPIRAATE